MPAGAHHGNGHVRKDYGVPNHMKGSVVSVGLIEVQEKGTKASDYNPKGTHLWFTPRLDTLNPCDKYRKVLKRSAALPESCRQKKPALEPSKVQ